MTRQPELFNRRLFLEPGEAYFEQQAVLNPTIQENNGELHLLYRAVDPDMVSSLGYLRARYNGDAIEIVERLDKPLYKPEYPFESHGVEDPRLVFFEGEYHLFYTAYDGYNARLAYASGNNFKQLAGRKLAGPTFSNEVGIKLVKDNPRLRRYAERWAEDPGDQALWEKDATILPRRVNGKIVFIHRLRPDVQIAYLDSMDQLSDDAFWEDYLRRMDEYIMMERVSWWEESHMGMGAVPIETPDGWLMIYHGVNRTTHQTYRAGAALFDLNDPQRCIGRTPEPLFEPEEDWEIVGDVNHVVFPEGVAQRDGVLDIFYGGADKVIGVISVRMDELIDYLKKVGVK